MNYLIDIEEPEEGLKRTEMVETTCMEEAQLIIQGQFPSWYVVNIKEYNEINNGYSKVDDHNPYPEE